MQYPNDYPDALPELKLTPVEGDITESEIEALVKDLIAVVCLFDLPALCMHAQPVHRVMRISEWR